MKIIAAAFLSGLTLSACHAEPESVLAAPNMDGQTVVPDYFGTKAYVVTQNYYESLEGQAVIDSLMQHGVPYVAVLARRGSTTNYGAAREIAVSDWEGSRWARDEGPLSALSHSSEALRLVQFGSLTPATRAMAKWMGRTALQGPTLSEHPTLLINGYADCFLSERDRTANTQGIRELREATGCRRITFLDSLKNYAVTNQLEMWVRFLADDELAVARLVDFTGNENSGEAPPLKRLRLFWDDQARAMSSRGYKVTRLPVFVHEEDGRRVFSSTIAGILDDKMFFAPEFPTLREFFAERYESEREALKRDLGALGFEVVWLPGGESASLGGSLQRAVLPVHENP